MDTEAERKRFSKYPFHIDLMVKALKKTLIEGRVFIKDGVPVFKEEDKPGGDNKK